MLVLGIESTCDETACAVVRDGHTILSNVISSQIDLHAAFGGVVPELACRRHIDVIIPVIHQALQEAKVPLSAIDLFAVSQGPGLIGALLIGINATKALSLALKKPFVGVNHIEAHLYASIMSLASNEMPFPCLGVVLSGGHTSFLYMQSPSEYQEVAHTVDDAIGEAFDKVAKILGLSYPGGPLIEALAKNGDPTAYKFKAGRVKENPLYFSFSGLKTAVLYATQNRALTELDKFNLSAAFQEAAFDDVIQKILIASKQFHCDRIVFGGGVTNNQYLRQKIQRETPKLHCFWPPSGLSLDNAAMIAGLGYHHYLSRGSDSITLEAFTQL